MRFGVASNSAWSKTGYGKQTGLMLPRFKELGHDVFGIATYGLGGGELDYNGIKWYPHGGDGYGSESIYYHSVKEKADFCMTLMDIWVYDPRKWGQMKWVPYLPVDTDDRIPELILERMKMAFTPIVYSKHAYRMAQEAGVTKALYVSHMYDPEVFRPIPKAQARSFEGLLFNNQPWPEDAYIFGVVADNKVNAYTPSRKSLIQLLEAFAKVRERHSDVILYLHTHPNPGANGINLLDIVDALGLPDGSVLMPSPDDYTFGSISEEYMANAYSAIDCLLAPSMGEGFGVPILEAQACGTPVIVGDWTAMSEVCKTGWKIDKSDAESWINPLKARWYLPHIGAIEALMEKAYNTPSFTPDFVAHAVREYRSDVVTGQWKTALDTIQERINEAATFVPKSEFERALQVV